ncbi:hypothetical protein KUV57_13435 [Epibacterium sp. DP7N7-1]|nr:hypothetical protein [Epibacterium sp. DP7N7-1]
MVFPVSDPFDNIDQQTLRSVCLATLNRIDRCRKQFMETCPNRKHLESASDEQRRLNFGALLMGGLILGRGRMLPGTNPEQFLSSLSGQERNANTKRLGLFSRAITSAGKGPEPGLRERMLPVLATWPGFDKNAYLAGEPQGDEFIAEFSIDYSVIRELAFEANKPWRLGGELESHPDLLGPILLSYQGSAFAGIDSNKLEAFMDEAVASLDDHDLEPVF